MIQELELILSTPRFQRAENLSMLLRWMVEQRVSSRQHLLNEHDIARLVFGIQDHDPTTNSRVRRQLSRLRNALRNFYGDEGVRRAECLDFRDGFIPELGPRAKSRYASINLAPALVRIRMLPFRTGDAGLSPHLLPLELELQDALLSLKHLRISQARGGGAPQLMLGAAVARFGKSTFVFAQVQDPGGIIVESVRAELKEDQYAACIRGIVPRLSSLLAHSEYLSSRRLINQ